MKQTDKTGNSSKIPRLTMNERSDMVDRSPLSGASVDRSADLSWILVWTPLRKFAFSVLN